MRVRIIYGMCISEIMGYLNYKQTIIINQMIYISTKYTINTIQII